MSLSFDFFTLYMTYELTWLCPIKSVSPLSYYVDRDQSSWLSPTWLYRSFSGAPVDTVINSISLPADCSLLFFLSHFLRKWSLCIMCPKYDNLVSLCFERKNCISLFFWLAIVFSRDFSNMHDTDLCRYEHIICYLLVNNLLLYCLI